MGFDYTTSDLLMVINKIINGDTGLWKSIYPVSSNQVLTLVLTSSNINTSALYVTSDDIIYDDMYSKYYPTVILKYSDLVEIIYNDRTIDSSILYILKLSRDLLTQILEIEFKSYQERQVVNKSFSELKRYKAKPRDDYSRYQNCDAIIYSNGEELLESMDRIRVPRSTEDKFYTVEANHENRLDLISNEVYGTPRLWWVIAYASNIVDPFDIPIDTILRIPPRDTIYKLIGGFK